MRCVKCEAEMTGTVCPECRYEHTKDDIHADRTYSYGLELLDKQEYSAALDAFLLAAEAEHAGAQNTIGMLYYRGLGVKRDYAEAMKWYKLAAEQGHAKAQNSLGYIYYGGLVGGSDHVEAFHWIKMAAVQGLAVAQYRLGYLYEHGEGIGENQTEAAKWYKKAAAQGYAKAQYRLGAMYRYGQGVERDDAEARKWYLLAARQGEAGAQNGLGYIYEHGEGVAQDYSEAIKWYRMAAEQGYPEAQNSMGRLYEQGKGVDSNYEKAVGWYIKAASIGYPEAQSNLGRMYEQGKGVRRNGEEAQKWYRLAAGQGSPEESDNMLSLDAFRKRKYKAAFDWAENERKRFGFNAPVISIKLEGDDFAHSTDGFSIALFYDYETDKLMMRRFWQDTETVAYNFLANKYDVLKEIAPKSLQELLDNGIELAGGREDSAGFGGEQDLTGPVSGRRPAAGPRSVKTDGNIFSLDGFKKEKYKEAFYWVEKERKSLGLPTSTVKMDVEKDELIYDKENCTMALYYNVDTKMAILRRTWYDIQTVMYSMVVNYDEVKEKTPKKLQELLDKGLEIYNYAKSIHKH